MGKGKEWGRARGVEGESVGLGRNETVWEGGDEGLRNVWGRASAAGESPREERVGARGSLGQEGGREAGRGGEG